MNFVAGGAENIVVVLFFANRSRIGQVLTVFVISKMTAVSGYFGVICWSYGGRISVSRTGCGRSRDIWVIGEDSMRPGLSTGVFNSSL